MQLNKIKLNRPSETKNLLCRTLTGQVISNYNNRKNILKCSIKCRLSNTLKGIWEHISIIPDRLSH